MRKPTTSIAAVLVAAATALTAAASTGAAQDSIPDRDAATEPTALRAGPDVPASSRPALAAQARRKPIGRNRLKRKLQRLARRAPGASGFYVFEIGAGKGKRVLFSHDAGKRRKLASNQKLFTTATALHRLGAHHRIETKVKASGKLTQAGRLKGNLYLVGAGDPSFGSGDVKNLANDVRRAGIRSVRGRVIADDSVFDRRRGVPDSGWGPSPYIAPLSGLVYGGSTYDGDPAKQAGRAFRDRLRKQGVKVGGKVRVDRLPGKLRSRPAVGSHGSPEMASLAASTNKPSDNFYAEMLLKRLWAKAGRRGTTNGGAKAVKRYARSLGAKVDARDGSGLTDNNRASPRSVVRLLVRTHREKGVGKPLYRSLAVAGKEGTLASRMNGTAAAGRCRAKTGTINGVSNLSGYCRSKQRTVAFSLLMNGVSSYDGARSVQDKMAIQIARFRR